MPYFISALADIKRTLGDSHPFAGIVLADMAGITRDAGDDSKSETEHAELQLKRHQDAAELLQAPTGDIELDDTLADYGVREFLLAVRGQRCLTPSGDEQAFRNYLGAAMLHRRQFGTAAEQVGWLGRAAQCTADNAKRLRTLRARSALARELGTAQALLVSNLDLSLAYLRMGRKTAARTIMREAFRWFAVMAKDARDRSELLSNYDFYQFSYDLYQPLQDLALKREMDLLFAVQISHQIANRDYTNNAGLSYVNSTATALELYGRSDISNHYNAFLASRAEHDAADPGERETTPAASVAARLSIYAEEQIAGEGYDLAVRILQRAVDLFEPEKNPREALLVLGRLARAYDEMGDFAKATFVARRALRIARTAKLDAAEVERSGLTALLDRNATRSDGDTALGALVSRLSAELSVSCAEDGGSPKALPALPLAQLTGDPFAVTELLRNPVAARYIECFDRFRPRLDGIEAPWADAVSADRIADVVFLHAAANNRDAAQKLFVFILDRTNWNVSKDDNALRSILPDRYLRHVAAEDRLSKARAYEHGDWAEALVAALRGLALGGRRTWVSVLDDGVAYLLAGNGLDYVLDDGDGVSTVTELGHILLSLGMRERARQVHEVLQNWSRRNRDADNPAEEFCFHRPVCAFFGAFAAANGNLEHAEAHRSSIELKLHIEYTGASATVTELDALTQIALDYGAYHEQLGQYWLASVYYGTAGASEDHLLALDDPLRSIDDLRAADAFARVSYRKGDPDAARRVTTHVLKAVRRRMETFELFGSDVVMRWSRRLRGLMETHLDTAPADADGVISADDELLLAMQYLQLTRTAATFTRLSARMGTRGGDLARRHQDLTARISNAYARLGVEPDTQTSEILGDIARDEQLLGKLTKRLERESPAYFRHGRLQFATVEALQETLQPGEAVLASYSGEDHAYLWLITDTKSLFRRLDVTSAALARTVKALRQRIGAEGSTALFGGISEVPLLQFHQLYRTVLGGFADPLADIEHLIFVPHGAFEGLPLSALLTERPPKASMPVAEVRASRLPWLIRRTAISLMPSLGSIPAQRALASASRAERPFLGIGNPTFGDGIHVAASSLRGVDPEFVRLLPLPETAAEVTRLATLLGADTERDLLLAGAASETHLKETALDDYRLIGFATHGLIAGEVTGLDEPALVLSKPETPTARDDGLLRASEVLELTFDADLVLLSACNTASGDGRPGAEGLSGMANAFFYAGARHLMVTHWYIPSDAAVEIATGLVQARQEDPGIGWARALQRSIVELIDSTGPATNAHPLSWGAHMIVGTAR